MFQVVSIIIIVILTALDRVSKMAAVSALKGGETKDFLFGLFKFRYVENTGAAFSAFSDNTAVLAVFTVLVIILCLFVLLVKKPPKFISACLILIVSGGIGNAIDRVVYKFVVDFIDPQFMNFAVFNVADCFITVGAFMLIIYEFYQLYKEKKEAKFQKETAQESND